MWTSVAPMLAIYAALSTVSAAPLNELNNASGDVKATLTAQVADVIGAFATAGVKITPNKNGILPDLNIKLCLDLWIFDPVTNSCQPPKPSAQTFRARPTTRSLTTHKTKHHTTTKHRSTKHHSPKPITFRASTTHKVKPPKFTKRPKPHKFVQPKGGKCPSGQKPHPFLAICIDLGFDIDTDLTISQPHALVVDSGKCGNGLVRHPKLLNICIGANVNYKLFLGTHASRPNYKGVCQAGWRKHATIANLCIQSSIDIVIMDNYNGRRYDNDGRCTAGWNAHPTVAGVCVDSALSLNLFANQKGPLANGKCAQGYRRHPVLDLCLVI